MNLLVTGSMGFIGQNLSSHFEQKRGIRVFGIELEDFYHQENWVSRLLNLVDEFNPDVIFHVGACSDTLEKDVNYMMNLNFESSKILADWCVENGKKLIFSSSAASYGVNSQTPSNLYGWSKYAAESYVIAKGGVALRYFNVYGPGESHKKNMASFIFQSYQKNKIGLSVGIFPGEPKRDFVYIDDVVSANHFALENFESLKNFWYDVGSGESRKFEDILVCINVKSFHYLNENLIPPGYQFYTQSSKFMKGWKPKYNLESGIKDYIKRLEHE